MSVIHTNKTGTGFNSGQTGAMADATNAPPPAVLLPDLVAGWALTAGPQQTLDSTGGIASGPEDLTANNAPTFGATGVVLLAASKQSLWKGTDSPLQTGVVSFAFSYVIKTTNGQALTGIALQKNDGIDAEYNIRLESAGGSNVTHGLTIMGYDSSYPAITSDPVNGDIFHAILCGYDNTLGQLFISVDGGTLTTTSFAGGNGSLASGTFPFATYDPTSTSASDYQDQICRYFRMWKGANAEAIANSSTYRTWLANVVAGEAQGRTDAELASYTG